MLFHWKNTTNFWWLYFSFKCLPKPILSTDLINYRLFEGCFAALLLIKDMYLLSISFHKELETAFHFGRELCFEVIQLHKFTVNVLCEAATLQIGDKCWRILEVRGEHLTNLLVKVLVHLPGFWSICQTCACLTIRPYPSRRNWYVSLYSARRMRTFLLRRGMYEREG